MLKNKIITWGVIGVGDVCEIKSVPAMYKLENSRVKSVMRRNPGRARDYADRHNIEHSYNDADKILDDPEIDIVYIATPPSSHAHFAIRAAEAGKHCYVEKPMASKYSECLDMIQAFEKADKKLFVAYYRRTLPNFLKIKDLIDSGVIGKPKLVNIVMNKTLVPENVASSEVNWRVNPEIAGGGYFYDLASHQLDFLDYIFGRVIKASGLSANQAGKYMAEDIVTANFIFENKVLGTGSWCFTTSEVSDIDKTTIVGEKGQIEYQTFGSSTVILKTDNKGIKEFNFELPVHIQSNLVESIINELSGKGLSPSTGKSAARTNWVMENINQFQT